MKRSVNHALCISETNADRATGHAVDIFAASNIYLKNLSIHCFKFAKDVAFNFVTCILGCLYMHHHLCLLFSLDLYF